MRTISFFCLCIFVLNNFQMAFCVRESENTFYPKSCDACDFFLNGCGFVSECNCFVKDVSNDLLFLNEKGVGFRFGSYLPECDFGNDCRIEKLCKRHKKLLLTDPQYSQLIRSFIALKKYSKFPYTSAEWVTKNLKTILWLSRIGLSIGYFSQIVGLGFHAIFGSDLRWWDFILAGAAFKAIKSSIEFVEEKGSAREKYLDKLKKAFGSN